MVLKNGDFFSALQGARPVPAQLLSPRHGIRGYGIPEEDRPEMWLGKLQPSKNPPKPQYRVDETNASHHRQIRRTDQELPLSATHLDRQGILSIHGIPQGGAQHQLQPEENR